MLFKKAIKLVDSLNDGVIVLNNINEITHFSGCVQKIFSLHIGEKFNEQIKSDLLSLFYNGKHIAYTDYQIKKKEVTIEGNLFKVITFNKYDEKIILKISALKQIIQSISEGVLVSDLNGRILFLNNEQEKKENLRLEDVIGKQLWDVYQFSPENSEHNKVIQENTPLLNQYRSHVLINGVPQYVAYNTFPLTKEDGTIFGAFSIGTNYTKRKEMLHEIVELKRSLYKKENKNSVIYDNGTNFNFEDIKGVSSSLESVIEEAQNVALYDTNILIVGETGTGKELFAQSIHNHSLRSNNPFVAVNCAAIPEGLLENTLFGSVKGAFTDSVDQPGLFEYAENGTLFLDEMNSMPLSLQAKLLRVLEERKIRRLGSNKVIPIHCRVITSSNEHPRNLIHQKKLREDLYYRISRYNIYIPALKNRKEDIRFYINFFLEKYSNKYKKPIQGISKDLMDTLLHYHWPGNVRELEHLLEKMVIMTKKNDYLKIDKIPFDIKREISIRKKENKQELSKVNIKSALVKTNYNITQAAKILGISRQNLQYHIRTKKIKAF